MSQQITVMALIKAKEALTKQVKQQLLNLITPTRTESGCLKYDLHQNPDDPASFMFYETWQSKNALDQHLQKPYLRELLAKTDQLFAQPLDVTIWQKLS